MSGVYIAFEGIEGAGKSTAAARVSERLTQRGVEVVRVREPGGTPAGERIRAVLLDGEVDLDPWTEANLFSASRAQLARDVIAPAVARGAWVLGDRSVYSSLAYQGGGRGLGIDDVRSINEPGLAGVWPDVVVLLRVEATVGLERQEIQDRIGAEGVEFQARVAATFDELAAADPDRFVVVDGSQDLEVVIDEIERELDRWWTAT